MMHNNTLHRNFTMLRFAKSGEFSRYRECLLLLLFSLSEKAVQ